MFAFYPRDTYKTCAAYLSEGFRMATVSTLLSNKSSVLDCLTNCCLILFCCANNLGGRTAAIHSFTWDLFFVFFMRRSQSPSWVSQVPTCFGLIQSFLPNASCSFPTWRLLLWSYLKTGLTKPPNQCFGPLLSKCPWGWLANMLEPVQVKLHSESANQQLQNSFPPPPPWKLRRGERKGSILTGAFQLVRADLLREDPRRVGDIEGRGWAVATVAMFLPKEPAESTLHRAVLLHLSFCLPWRVSKRLPLARHISSLLSYCHPTRRGSNRCSSPELPFQLL